MEFVCLKKKDESCRCKCSHLSQKLVSMFWISGNLFGAMQLQWDLKSYMQLEIYMMTMAPGSESVFAMCERIVDVSFSANWELDIHWMGTRAEVAAMRP